VAWRAKEPVESRRGPGRRRELPVREGPLSDYQAFERLKADRRHNTYRRFRCSPSARFWRRTGGTVAGVVASGFCSRRTVCSRLSSCHEAGFEPEQVEWAIRTGAEWEEFLVLQQRHLEDDLASERDDYNRRTPLGRLLRSKPDAHPDLLEDRLL
jgi:hypothetical protein